MEALTISTEQKDKLLEMCKYFFPEFVASIEIYEQYDGSTGFVCLQDLSFSSVGDYIHWVEFCHRFLTIKLDDLYFQKVMNPIDPYDKRNYKQGKEVIYPDNWKELWGRRPFIQYNNNMNGMEPKSHPIDYLYKEYLKLCQNP